MYAQANICIYSNVYAYANTMIQIFFNTLDIFLSSSSLLFTCTVLNMKVNFLGELTS